MSMTAARFRSLRGYLGYTKAEIADYLDVSEASVRNWDKGAHPIPLGVEREMLDLRRQTQSVVDALSKRFEGETVMLIPRSEDEAPGWMPEVDRPDPVTLEWWKVVGERVCGRVPGLTLDWP